MSPLTFNLQNCKVFPNFIAVAVFLRGIGDESLQKKMYIYVSAKKISKDLGHFYRPGKYINEFCI
jgi:hypothetical protein